MEIALGLVAAIGVAAAWLVGRRRLRDTEVAQRATVQRLEGQRVSAAVVVGVAPLTKGLQLVADAGFRVVEVTAAGHVRVADVRVEATSTFDTDTAAARLEHNGVELDDIRSITTTGERFDFQPELRRHHR